jgi:hypothetical protein
MSKNPNFSIAIGNDTVLEEGEVRQRHDGILLGAPEPNLFAGPVTSYRNDNGLHTHSIHFSDF